MNTCYNCLMLVYKQYEYFFTVFKSWTILNAVLFCIPLMNLLRKDWYGSLQKLLNGDLVITNYIILSCNTTNLLISVSVLNSLSSWMCLQFSARWYEIFPLASNLRWWCLKLLFVLLALKSHCTMVVVYYYTVMLQNL